MKKKMRNKKNKKYNKFFSYNCAERQNKNFSYKDFSYSNSYNTRFTNSIFYGNSFYKATMKYCGFNGCKFSFIEFKNTNFRKCRFKGAYFENVIFENCNLSDTNFQGATFKNVYFTNTSLKGVKGIKNTNLLTKIDNCNVELSLKAETLKVINECKINPYIVSSETIFYKKKARLNNEKSLSKQEQKQLQRKHQEELLLHPKQLTLHKINIIRLLDNYTEEEIARGLHLAATSIDKKFSSLSYFIPYIKKANCKTTENIGTGDLRVLIVETMRKSL